MVSKQRATKIYLESHRLICRSLEIALHLLPAGKRLLLVVTVGVWTHGVARISIASWKSTRIGFIARCKCAFRSLTEALVRKPSTTCL